MVYAMVHAQNIPPEIQLDIWQWLKHNIGMEASILLLFSIVVLAWLVKLLFFRSKQTPTFYNSGTIDNSIKINTNIAQETPPYKVWKGSSLRERDWIPFHGNLTPYELAAGRRATLDPVYITNDGFPQLLVMCTSARVFTVHEEAFNPELQNGYALIQRKTPGAALTNERFGRSEEEHNELVGKLYADVATDKNSDLPIA